MAVASVPIDDDTASLRAAAVVAVDALNKHVAGLYPIGTKLTVRHPGDPMKATVVRHPKGCYHAGELLVKARSGQRQWIALDRILTVEWQLP